MLILEYIWLSFLNYPIGCVHEGLFLLSFTLKMRITTDRWIRFKDIKTLRFGELFLCFDIQSQLYFLEASFHFVKAYPADICIVIFFLFDHTLRSTRKYISDPITRNFGVSIIHRLGLWINQKSHMLQQRLGYAKYSSCLQSWLIIAVYTKETFKNYFRSKVIKIESMAINKCNNDPRRCRIRF